MLYLRNKKAPISRCFTYIFFYFHSNILSEKFCSSFVFGAENTLLESPISFIFPPAAIADNNKEANNYSHHKTYIELISIF